MANTSGVRIDFERVRLDPKEVQKLLGDRAGPVIRRATEVSQLVQTRARQLVGKDTHVLEHSIVKRFVNDSRGPHIEVGVFSGPAKDYALIHHEGRGPIIGRPLLVFRSKLTGLTVFARRVKGVAPNRFLVDAARQLGLRVTRGRGG